MLIAEAGGLKGLAISVALSKNSIFTWLHYRVFQKNHGSRVARVARKPGGFFYFCLRKALKFDSCG
jgi:hypothetical protein